RAGPSAGPRPQGAGTSRAGAPPGPGGGPSMSPAPPPRPRRPLGLAAAGALLAVLVPKCPMCLAMYLSFLGAAASWFVWLRPLGVALTMTGLAVAAWRHLGRGNRGWIRFRSR